MRIPEPRSQAIREGVPLVVTCRTSPDRVAVRNASVSNLIQILNLTLLPNYLSEVARREPKICVRPHLTRRLCGN